MSTMCLMASPSDSVPSLSLQQAVTERSMTPRPDSEPSNPSSAHNTTHTHVADNAATPSATKYRGLCWDRKHQSWRCRIFYASKQVSETCEYYGVDTLKALQYSVRERHSEAGWVNSTSRPVWAVFDLMRVQGLAGTGAEGKRAHYMQCMLPYVLPVRQNTVTCCPTGPGVTLCNLLQLQQAGCQGGPWQTLLSPPHHICTFTFDLQAKT